MGDEEELAMMKFLILALALSTIATQANPVPQEFDETDDVDEVSSFVDNPAGFKQPENAQAAVIGANVHTHHSKTCNEPCPTFWWKAHAKCAEGAEYKACTAAKWHTCVTENGGSHITFDYMQECWGSTGNTCPAGEHDCKTGACNDYWKTAHAECTKEGTEYHTCATHEWMGCVANNGGDIAKGDYQPKCCGAGDAGCPK